MGGLDEALISGKRQNSRFESDELFDSIYESDEMLNVFTKGTSSFSELNFKLLTQTLDLKEYKSVLDIGGGNGALSCLLLEKYNHLNISTFDLPHLKKITHDYIQEKGFLGKINIIWGDFKEYMFPSVDVVILGNILHFLEQKDKIFLLKKVYNSLNEGGILVAFDCIIDEERKNSKA